MSESKIRVLVVHAFPETTSYVSALLGLESDIALLGSVNTGHEAIKKTADLRPDVILVGSELADIDSPTLVRQLVSQSPGAGVIVLLGSDDPDQIRRYMQAGARSFLVLPFSSEQLVSTVREVYRRVQSARVARPAAGAAAAVRGRTIAVFGPKGGSGKTMLAVNLAVLLRQSTDRPVVLVDANFAFGDLHLLMNAKPEHTIVDFIERGAEGDLETLQRILHKHSSGVRILVRPERPEHAEMITAENFRRLLDLLAQAYEFVVVDCHASYDERTLMVLDRADTILLVVMPDVGSLYNAGIFLDLTRALGYPRDRVRVVLNRQDSQVGISLNDVEAALSHPVDFRIPSRYREVASTLNVGVPIVISQPNCDVARGVAQIATYLVKRGDGK